jgi:flagellar biosynthesis protein FlhA
VIKFIRSNIVVVFVVIVVLMLIIPLPTVMLDTLILVNIAISLMILMITMYISEALEFSIFPSLLLITTIYRLALNISSTRLILSNGGSAGKVIQTIGSFVLQGNVVVGLIIYLIIVLVQFIVITKGAERVSEVAARFTLDAMPGKQMAIDADLSYGLITEQQARERRHKIQKEADFYGAMDGATKIVKGDSIMSIITTAINFIAGIIIGLVQGGMTFSEVLNQYTIATIGDGLVSQIPALLISTATGMIVTRSVSEGSLSLDVLNQFSAQPRTLMFAGIIIFLVAFIPGAPKVQPVILGSILIFCGWKLRVPSPKEEEQAVSEETGGGAEADAQHAEEVFDENAYFKNVDNIYSLINVEPIELEFGYSLIPLVDESSGGNLINRIVIFRRQYAQEMGFVIPSIRLRDSSTLNANQYIIKIKGEQVAMGEILIDYYLALEPSDPMEEIDGIDTVEPAYGIPSKWILPENRDLAEMYGYTVIDPLSVMLTHLSETIKQHVHELLSRTEVQQIV